MERFAAIDFETANGKRSSICSIGIAILEDDWVVDSIYTLVRPTPNFYTRWTTAIHGLSVEDTNDADRKSTRLNSSHRSLSRMPSSA